MKRILIVSVHMYVIDGEKRTYQDPGILYDLGSHLIDQALSLFGKPNAISADVIKQRPGAEIDDYFHIVLHYGVKRVILRSSSYVKKAGPHFTLHGDKGSIVKYGMDSQEEQLKME